MVSVHPDTRALSAATLIAKVKHGLLHAEVNIGNGYHQFHADNLLARDLREHRETMVPISKIVDVGGPGNEKFRHSGRLDKCTLHDVFPAAGVVVFFAGKASNHGVELYTSYKSREVSVCHRNPNHRGKFTLTPYRNPDVYGGVA